MNSFKSVSVLQRYIAKGDILFNIHLFISQPDGLPYEWVAEIKPLN